MKAKILPLLFTETNDHEKKEFANQLAVLSDMYPGLSPTHNEAGGSTPNLTKSNFSF